MTEEWYCEQLKHLGSPEERQAALQEIHKSLNATRNLENRVTERLLSSPELYECLEKESLPGTEDSDDKDQDTQNLISDILSICLENLTLQESDMPRLLERALTHRNVYIRSKALHTLCRELEKEKKQKAKITELLSDDLLKHILKALQEPEFELGMPALTILSLVLPYYLDRSYVNEFLHDSLRQSGVIKCRIYELAVEVAKISSQILQEVQFVLDHALSELDNDDVLVQVSVLEVFVPLAETGHGLKYMEQHQVFDVMSKKLEDIDNNPIDRLLVPGILKFFGKIASLEPQRIITGYPMIMAFLFETFNNAEHENLPTAFDIMANLCQTESGVKVLHKHYETNMQKCFESYYEYIQRLSIEIRKRAFSSLEAIFAFENTISTEASDILQVWFTHLCCGSNMQFLYDICRNPFPDIKVLALSLVAAVCLYKWGVQALQNTAGFVEYLLDRSTEFDNNAKLAKYCVIEILASSNAFDVDTTSRLQRYFKEGPNYVQPVMDVALDGE